MSTLFEAMNIQSSPYAMAIVSLLVYVLAAKATDLLIDKVLRRFTRVTFSRIDDDMIDILHRPVYFTIILAGVMLSLDYIRLSQSAASIKDGVIYTAITLLWTMTAIRISNLVIEDAIKKVSDVTGLSRDMVPLIENISKIAIVVIGGMVVFSIWGINITPLLASAGIVGVAVAIAAKDTISNFFGGISVFMDRPFKVGDYVVLDQGERGEVIEIGLRSTRIQTRDNILITVPNSIIANTKIINESAPIPNFRVRIPVQVAYGSDLDLVERTLLEIASANSNVLPDPEPRVRFRTFGDSGLNLELLCWAQEPALRGLTIHELNISIYNRFNELGIVFPFPQRDVHVHPRQSIS